MPTASVRREIHYQGRVQGVGFRQTTHSIAARFRVVGFVQNLPDGRVRLVVEGEPGELDRFVSAVNIELDRYIKQALTDELPASGEFNNFEIRF